MLVNFLSRFYHACWYITAAIIISAAIAVTVIRLMLPHINNYKPQVEAWLSDNSDYAITVKHIEAHWEGWTPTMILQGVQVSDRETDFELTTLKSVSVTINPYLSLQQRDFSQLQITIVGPGLLITREIDGSIEFTNMYPGSQQQIKASHEFFANWILQQQSIAIENASITYVDKLSTHPDLVLTNVNLHFRNSHLRTQVEATANLPEEYGDTIKVSVDAFGDITSPGWNGQIYFEGNHIYPARLFGTSSNIGYLQAMESTPATIQLWSNWREGRAEKFQANIAATDIQLPTSRQQDKISVLAAAVSVDRSGPGISASINFSELRSNHGDWQPAVINIYSKNTDDNASDMYVIESSYLKIEDIIPVLHYIDPGQFNNQLWDIRGILQNSQLIYTPAQEQQLLASSDIRALKVTNLKNNSTISVNGGFISGALDWGQLQLHAATLKLSLPDYFNQTINFYELDGDINWTFTKNGLLVETDYLEAHTPHFDTSGKGKMIFDADMESPLIDMQISYKSFNLDQLVNYLPTTVHSNVRDWMKSSLVSGEISSLEILNRGYLHDFPYENLQGSFQAIAKVNNAELNYHPEWIPVENLDAEFRMENNRIDVTSDRGSIHNAQIHDTVATIPDVTSDKPELLVTGKVNGNTADARYIIDNSPLSVSGTLSSVRKHDINGLLALDLSMNIPFHNQDLQYNGVLQLSETRMESPVLGITLENIEGNIRFSSDNVTSGPLSATYSGQPVVLGINSVQGSRLKVELEGLSDSHFIASQLVHFFPDLAPAAEKLQSYIKGETQWLATLIPDNNNDTTVESAQLLITTDLSGLTIDLPEPVGKDTEPASLKISTVINDDPGENIQIDYKNKLRAGLSIKKNGDSSLHRAEIAMGNDLQLFNSGNGIFIHGDTEYLSLSDWENFIQSIEPRKENTNKHNIQVDLQVDTLAYLNQQFNNADLRINNLQPDLYVTIEGNNINGKIILPENLQLAPVKATFSVLHLQDHEAEKYNENTIIDPRTKPALDMTVSDFQYGNLQLGELTLITSKLPTGLSIDNIDFNKPHMKINGSGRWEMVDGVPRSEFEFKLKADKLDTMLSTFDYSVAPIKDGKTKLDLNATWQGSPMDFSLPEINGNLGMDIEQGQFLDIEPSAGRLFGLLSLQTLPRRLSLDFSDLFGKGFSFDQIEGSFTIESGDAYTNNLYMTGPSANIQVSGRTGLVEKDYDQIVTVTPQISDSLPVASALFGPIGAGVGAVIFLAGELFESIPRQLDKLLRYQYSVKGSWDDPVVERIKTSSNTSTTADSFPLQ